MSKKSSRSVLLIACMYFAVSGGAVAGWIVRETTAVEAEHISVKTDKDTHAVTVLVRGCDVCPLDLMTNANTKYFLKEKQVKGSRAHSLSGRQGTVIYDADKTLVIRVRW